MPTLVLSCSKGNDLLPVLRHAGVSYRRLETPDAAVRAAERGAGVLLLARDYPPTRTVLPPGLLNLAFKRSNRLYIECPTAPLVSEVQPLREARLERGVVASEWFGAELARLRIVNLNACPYIPARAQDPHLVLARVAGVDQAVFGLEGTEQWPLLFEHPGGNALVATTTLSSFVSGRFMPTGAWAVVWRRILQYLQPDARIPDLVWHATVRPSFSRAEPLPPGTELRALARSADWLLRRSRMLRHPAWSREILDLSEIYNTVRDMPSCSLPVGNGSLGILEGFSSTIRADGSQPMRYAVRNDGIGETAMELAFHSVTHGDSRSAEVAANLIDYTLLHSPLARGPRADPGSPSYGLVAWSLDHRDTYYGDDNARAMIGTLTVGALLGETRWDDAVVRCLLGNFRTTGPKGYRPAHLSDGELARNGWRYYWDYDYTRFSAHAESWLWTCFFWAYAKTRYEPFLERARTGVELLVAAYPDQWEWCIRSGTIDRARAILPLAWLVRLQDTPRHREWLRLITTDLIALQDNCGAIREIIGDGRQGTASNAEYGTREVSLIQRNGDPVADLLYSCNFAFIGLHEAASATGEAIYSEAEDLLADFLCRAQIRSERHPEMDGAWYRAFNYAQWDYWASNADWEWGPWCTESGWCQPWIGATLALRQMHTSLWELLTNADSMGGFRKCLGTMLPSSVSGQEQDTQQ